MALLLTLLLGGWMHYAQAAVYNGNCGADGNNLTWSLDTYTGVLTISGTGEMASYYGTGTPRPWESYIASIKSVILPEGITAIGTWAFRNHTSLATVNLPSTLTNIGSQAFCATAITSVEIPSGLTGINNWAFKDCASLTTVRLPASIANLPTPGAFCGCTSLQEVYVLWETADKIPTCTNSSNFFHDLSTKPKLYVPCGTTSLYKNKGWANKFTLTEVVANGTCGSNLTWSLNTCGTLTISGTGAMTDWSAAEEVPWNNYRSSITSVVLPVGLTSIGGYAFSDCAITKIDLPAAIRTLGKHSFVCGLQELYIPEGVTALPDQLFHPALGYAPKSTPIKRLYLPSTLTTIGSASLGHHNLDVLTYPASVTNVGLSSYYCGRGPVNKDLYASWPADQVVPLTTGIRYSSCPGNIKMHIPYGTTAAYKSKGWNQFYTLVEDVDERAIDLGLSIRWASCNVGATAPEENGTHFMWGDTIARSQYKWSAYPYSGTALNTLTKYNTRTASGTIDNRTTLIAFDDAAYINWGETWRMPTEAEWQELLDNCTLEKTTLNGVDVIKVTGPNGNFIYLPSVGYKMDTHDGTGYCYWSSSLNTGELDDGCNKAIYLNGTSGLKKAYRYIGMGVRAVYRREWPSFTLTICDTTDGSTYTKAINAAATYTLTAKEDDCHTFVRWSDGNTDNPRTVTVTADANYTAEYEEITYSGTCGPEGHESDVTWLLNLCDSTLTISGTGAMADWGSQETAPWYGQKDIIKTIIVSDGITTIGSRAFHRCNNLESATLPEGLTEIKEYAFYECGKLVSVTIPDGVTSIGEWAFYKCSALPSIDIPNSVTSIGIDVFFNCANLSSATLSTALTVIPKSIFQNCAKLESIEIPSGVTTIENHAFYGCKKLSAITIPDKVTSIKKNAFQRCSGLTSVVIPNTVTEIGNYAFSECSNLQSVEIQGTTSLGESAFERCGKLETFTISGVVTSLGKTAFSECSNLTSISFPEGLTSIGYSAFSQCGKLASVTIPDGVTSIGEGAFFWCEPLTSFDIPSSVTGIGDYALLWCTDLAEVNVHWTKEDQILTCPADIHDKDKDDVILHIPCNTQALYEAKKWNTHFTLEEVGAVTGTCGATGHESDITWNFCPVDSTLTISGTGAMMDYSSSGIPWYSHKDQIKHVIIEEGVTNIGSNAFYNHLKLISVTNPSTLRIIGDYACMNCKKLETFNFPDGLQQIGGHSFYECNSLQAVYIPASVTLIRADAFLRCSSVTSIVVDPANTVYDSRDNCNAIIEKDSRTLLYGCRNSVIPDGVQHVQDWAFEYQHNLTSIRISNTVQSFGTSSKGGVFKECENLKDIYVEWTSGSRIPAWNQLTRWYEHSNLDATITLHVPCGKKELYENKTGWKNYIIEDNHSTGGICGADGANMTWLLNCGGDLTIDGTGAMANYPDETAPWYSKREDIKTITIGSSITDLGNYAFHDCTNITDIYVSWTDEIPAWPTDFTTQSPATIQLHVPCEAKSLYQAAEGWKEYMLIGDEAYTVTVQTETGDTSQGNVSITIL